MVEQLLRHVEQKVVNVWLYRVKQSFSFSQRLHKQEEFSHALGNKAKRNKWLVIHSVANDLNKQRLGMIVGKRYMAKAVDRNHIKRVIRETFRNCTEIAAPLDVVVRVRCAPRESEMQDFRMSLLLLLKLIN